MAATTPEYALLSLYVQLEMIGGSVPLLSNKSVNADAQSRSAATPRLSLVAGYVRR